MRRFDGGADQFVVFVEVDRADVLEGAVGAPAEDEPRLRVGAELAEVVAAAIIAFNAELLWLIFRSK